MPKPISIPGYGAFIRADQMGVPASAGMVPDPAVSTLQEAYFDGGDPTNSLLAQSVHGFMDANPDLGAGGAASLPPRASQRLFQSLMSKYYGKPDYAAMREDPEFSMFVDQNADGYTPTSPQSSLVDDFIDAMYAPFVNQIHRQRSNEIYDLNQPYGYDFNYGAPDFYGGKYSRPAGSGEAVAGDGEIVSAPDDPLLPIARTAGSMVIPMLFNALMRGGN